MHACGRCGPRKTPAIEFLYTNRQLDRLKYGFPIRNTTIIQWEIRVVSHRGGCGVCVAARPDLINNIPNIHKRNGTEQEKATGASSPSRLSLSNRQT